MPELNLGAGVKRWADGGLSGSGALFSVGLQLPAWNRGQDQRQRLEAEARAADARRTLAQEELGVEAQGLWREARELAEAARGLHRHAFEEGPKLLKGLEASFEAGETSLFELLEAHRGALDAELQALDLAASARTARIELDLRLGRTEP
jgi:cobalt-zinc-cadmium efflux system outer membrane protein